MWRESALIRYFCKIQMTSLNEFFPIIKSKKINEVFILYCTVALHEMIHSNHHNAFNDKILELSVHISNALQKSFPGATNSNYCEEVGSVLFGKHVFRNLRRRVIFGAFARLFRDIIDVSSKIAPAALFLEALSRNGCTVTFRDKTYKLNSLLTQSLSITESICERELDDIILSY